MYWNCPRVAAKPLKMAGPGLAVPARRRRPPAAAAVTPVWGTQGEEGGQCRMVRVEPAAVGTTQATGQPWARQGSSHAGWHLRRRERAGARCQPGRGVAGQPPARLPACPPAASKHSRANWPTRERLRNMSPEVQPFWARAGSVVGRTSQGERPEPARRLIRPLQLRVCAQPSKLAGTLLAFLTTQAASTLAASILQTSASPLQRRPNTSRLYKPPFGCTRHSAQTAFQPQSPGASSLEPLPCPGATTSQRAEAGGCRMNPALCRRQRPSRLSCMPGRAARAGQKADPAAAVAGFWPAFWAAFIRFQSSINRLPRVSRALSRSPARQHLPIGNPAQPAEPRRPCLLHGRRSAGTRPVIRQRTAVGSGGYAWCSPSPLHQRRSGGRSSIGDRCRRS